jgi:hypothetical protein
MIPLMLAASPGNVETTSALVRHRADPSLSDWEAALAETFNPSRN